MAAADILPIDPWWPVSQTNEADVLAWRAASGEQFRRDAGPHGRVFSLAWRSLSYTDWQTLLDFYKAHRTDFFTFDHKTEERKYSVYFQGPLQENEVGNNSVDVSGVLVEAAGKPLHTYPTAPLIEIPLSEGVAITGGVMFVYAGYGYKITGGGVTDVELDGVSLGADLEKFDVALLLHSLLIQPGIGSVTKLEAVR